MHVLLLRDQIGPFGCGLIDILEGTHIII
jgi:hypothetical protein